MWINISETKDGFTMIFRRSVVKDQSPIIERIVVAMLVTHGIRRTIPYSELMEAAKNIQDDEICFTLSVREGTLMLFAEAHHREPRKDIKQDTPRHINPTGKPRGTPVAYPRHRGRDEKKS